MPEATVLELGQEQPVEPIGRHADDGPVASGPVAATDLAGLAGMIAESLRSGEIQVTQGEARTIDLTGTGVADQIRAALDRHGIGTEGSGVRLSASDLPGLQDDILSALRDAGVSIDPDPGQSDSSA